MHSVMVAPHNGKTVVIIVFHGDAFERVQQNDPAIIEGSIVNQLRWAAPDHRRDSLFLPETDFMICYEPEQEAFEAKCRELVDPKAILQWLARGWVNRPEERDTVIKITSI